MRMGRQLFVIYEDEKERSDIIDSRNWCSNNNIAWLHVGRGRGANQRRTGP